MRKKEEKLIITFHTTADSMAMEQFCKENGIPGRLIPVPKIISAGCGLCWCTRPGTQETILKAIGDAGLSYQDAVICMI